MLFFTIVFMLLVGLAFLFLYESTIEHGYRGELQIVALFLASCFWIVALIFTCAMAYKYI